MADVLLDTVYIQALLNRHDQHHAAAIRILPAVQSAGQVWITEAVLTEVANALSDIDRPLASDFVRSCYREANVRVMTVDTDLLMRGLLLYESRPDKQWSLTDCVSFVVMADNDIQHAATADRHFVQAGYVALMLDGD